MKKWWVAVVLFVGSTPAVDAAGSVPGHGAPAHTVVLSDARPLAAGQWAEVDAVAGQRPGAAHAEGTVIVAQASAQEPSPSVTEWDLASGALLRSATLPIPASQADLRLVRAAGEFHAFATRAPRGPILYARLDAAFRVEQVETLGFGERPRVATDGNVIAALWEGAAADANGARPSDRGWRVLLLNGRGHTLWKARVARAEVSTHSLGNPLAVVAGHVFVLLPDLSMLSVVEFSPDGREQRVTVLSSDREDGRLFVSTGTLFFSDGCTGTPLWSRDGLGTGLALLARGRLARRDRGRVCASPEAVSDEHGRWVTADGDVRAPSTEIEAHFSDAGDAAERRPLWVFGVAALLVVEREQGHVRVDWMDARP